MKNMDITTSEQLVEKMKEGDERCSIPLGSTVVKTESEKGDFHEVGTEGKTIGSLFDENSQMSCYLVDFNNNGALTFIIGPKIKIKEES